MKSVCPQNVKPMTRYRQVTIVGVGLIGGSIGLGLKERKLAEKIVGVGRRQESLEKAIAVGAIDEATTDLDEGAEDAELVVVASPVAAIAGQVRQSLSVSGAETFVTDAGSTKAAIVAEVTASGDLEVSRFVGSHPLAGDHRSGPEFARGNLLDDRVVVLTPHGSSSSEGIAKVESFWQNLGAQVVKMSPEEHDQALAATSHLPHVVASALAGVTPEKWLPLAATGWQDTTRVASGDAELWTQIFDQNRDAVLAAIEELSQEMDRLKTSLTERDWNALKDILQNAKRIRDAVGN